MPKAPNEKGPADVIGNAVMRIATGGIGENSTDPNLGNATGAPPSGLISMPRYFFHGPDDDGDGTELRHDAAARETE